MARWSESIWCGLTNMIDLAAYVGPPKRNSGGCIPFALDHESGTALVIRERRACTGRMRLRETMCRRSEAWRRTQRGRSARFRAADWEDRAIGAIFVARNTVSPFSEHEISLLKTFADQAAIAIQNARMFNETKEALERQTATANVLKAISQIDLRFGRGLRNADQHGGAVVPRVARRHLQDRRRRDRRAAGLFGATHGSDRAPGGRTAVA